VQLTVIIRDVGVHLVLEVEADYIAGHLGHCDVDVDVELVGLMG